MVPLAVPRGLKTGPGMLCHCRDMVRSTPNLFGLVSLLLVCLAAVTAHGAGKGRTYSPTRLARASSQTEEKEPDSEAPKKPEEKSENGDAGKKSAGSDAEKKSGDSSKKNGFDSAVVAAGQTAFNDNCLSCHDAQKSLAVKKSLSAWRATVRRMAEKDGAQIPESTHEPITTYLASLNEAASGKDEGSGGGASAAASPLSLTGTFSPTWRGGGSSQLQDPGPFADVWVGGAWQSDSPVSGKATACLSCHNQGNQYGRLDLVEASIRLDLLKAFGCKGSGSGPQVKAAVEAGRFVVPFGAFYQQVNPGVYRAVSRPLIFNMGQRVNIGNLGDPVLPMPYSDQGAVFNLALPFDEKITAIFDAYAVGGLQGNLNGIDFIASRSYVDNNRSLSYGGRLSVGGKQLRLGASAITGRFNPDALAGPANPPMNYNLFGVDALFRYEDLLRIQFEYAERDTDRFGAIPAPAFFRERIGGSYLEGELLLSREWKLSLYGRYDNQLRSSLLPPPGSLLTTGNFNVERVTYGLNWSLPGGSLLMFNLEHWYLPAGLNSINVAGVRWAATF